MEVYTILIITTKNNYNIIFLSVYLLRLIFFYIGASLSDSVMMANYHAGEVTENS